MMCCCKPAKGIPTTATVARVSLTRLDPDLDGNDYEFGSPVNPLGTAIERNTWTPPPTGSWRETRQAYCFIWPDSPNGIPPANQPFQIGSNQAAIASGNLNSFPRSGAFELHGTGGDMFCRDIDFQTINLGDPVNNFAPSVLGTEPLTLPIPGYPAVPPLGTVMTELDALFAQWRNNPTIVLTNLFDPVPTLQPVFEVGLRFTTIHDDGANGQLALNEGNVYFGGYTSAP